ncbi:MAG: ATP-binding cassette domain-containing protein [Acidimicrobiales bacterium]
MAHTLARPPADSADSADTATPTRRRLASSSAPWSTVAVIVAVAVAVPVLLLAVGVLQPNTAMWSQQWRTRLPGQLLNTFVLLAGTAAGSCVLGASLAWVVSAYRFPGVRLLSGALILPLAVPGYILGFLTLSTFGRTGPIQDQWAAWFGRDAWFPPVESIGGAIVTFTLVLYPYVYLLARAALRDQAAGAYHAARVLGAGPGEAARRIVLPLVRPAIAAGAAVVMMETLTDFATVQYFGVDTVTVGVFRIGRGTYDRDAASELATLVLGFALLGHQLERAARRRARFGEAAGSGGGIEPVTLRGGRAALATALCALPVLLAFAGPVARLVVWAVQEQTSARGTPQLEQYPGYLSHSLQLVTVTVVVVMVVATVLANAMRFGRATVTRAAARVAVFGWQVPGPVVGMGVLLAVVGLDDVLERVGGNLAPGVAGAGSLLVLFYAYAVLPGPRSGGGRVRDRDGVGGGDRLGPHVGGQPAAHHAAGAPAARSRVAGGRCHPGRRGHAEGAADRAAVAALRLRHAAGVGLRPGRRIPLPAGGTPGAVDRGGGGAAGAAAVAAAGAGYVTGGAGSALELRGVTKRFGATVAVDHATLMVGPGELLALVGPSGCGKSTLLRLVAGLHHSDAGTIEIGGRVVDDAHHVRLAPEHRRVGLVFQEHALFPHLSVSDNVAFGLRRDPQRGERAAEMLDLVGSAVRRPLPHELRPAGSGSGWRLPGRWRRCQQLLLLDEPFASLDPNLQPAAQRRVRILRAAGTAAVLVTHDQAEALASGERVAVMHDGVIVQCDAPGTVFHSPATRFVAGFMGEADFLDGAGLALFGVDEAADGPAAVTGAGAATFMVRPDDVALVADDRGPATVVDAEFRGSTWCYTVELPGGRSVRALRSHIEPLQLGDTVRVELVAGHRPVRLPAHDADVSR